jgi:hypothetical protein
MVILYVLAAAVVPEGPASGAVSTLTPAVGGGSIAIVFGAVLVMLGIAGVANEWLRVDWDLAWPIGLIGLGVAVLFGASRRH